MGANGTGKSTLMKVLAGLETLDYGGLQQTRGMSIGYLPQEGLALAGRSVFEECLTVFDEIRDMEKEIERLSGQLAVLDHAGPEYESAAERFSMLQERFHALDGYALDAQVGRCSPGLDSARKIGRARPMSSAADGRCGLRWPSFCWPSRICCYSTSLPTTSTLKPVTGSKTIFITIPSDTFLFRTIVTSWM